jgi:hypothetical protein
MASRQVSLSINNVSIDLDYFAQGFIDHTIGGILEALEGTGPMTSLELAIDQGKVKIVLNNAPVPLNAFANKIINNTVAGMVSSLKGVSEIKKITIGIKK